MEPRRIIPVVVAAAIIGGIVAGGAVALVDGGGSTKTETVVQQSPLSGTSNPAAARGDGDALTPATIYKRDAPGVVYVKSDIVQQSDPSDDPFGFGQPQEQRGTATGSGFVVDKQGDILTNAHVVQGAVKVNVQLQDKRSVAAKVIGKDTSTDLALLKVDPDGLNLKPLQLGRDAKVAVGDPVIAIGNPFGLDRTLTTGVVSALQRQIPAPNGFQIDNVIQTDAAINPGNSGGPLIDAAGRVIGINSQIQTGGSGSDGNVGIGFAVPIDTARKILPQLKKNGKVEQAYLGLQSISVDGSLTAADPNLPAKSGALVQSVQQGSPAEKAGIRAGGLSAQMSDGTPIQLGGDTIVSVDGKKVTSSDSLADLVSAKKPGDSAKVGLVRGDGSKKTVTVKLASRPNNASEQLQGSGGGGQDESPFP